MDPHSTQLILASRSPRRSGLLHRLGMSFTVCPSDVEEVIPDGQHPAEVVERLALAKAVDVARRYPAGVVLGADTVVVVDQDIIGKPENANDAVLMLQRLSGRTHRVYTGIALVAMKRDLELVDHEVTHVTFATLAPDEISAYVATGSPLDKAGAYGIQDDHGAFFVSRIDGDFYNVMGLPLHRLYVNLRTHFPELPVFETVAGTQDT